jgi:hypothetical protein
MCTHRSPLSTQGNADNSNYEFAPPPLYSAHVVPIPESLDPNTAINVTGPAFGADTDTTKVQNGGFLVYGGVGGGGFCGTDRCGGMQRVLGQVYRFSLSEAAWTAPRTVTGVTNENEVLQYSADGSRPLKNSLAKSANGPDSGVQYVQSTVWEYARLTTSDEVNDGELAWTDRGKLLKSFALEDVVMNTMRGWRQRRWLVPPVVYSSTLLTPHP